MILVAAACGAAAFLVACPPTPVRAPTASPAPAAPQQPAPQPLAVASRPPSAAAVPPEHPQPEANGLVAVIIDDAGYNLDELQAFLDLPMPLTIAVLPRLPHSTEAARRVLAAGKDLILHGPMEPDGGENPGPGVILTGMSPDRIRAVLDQDFESVPGALGMNNHMGSKATADPEVMRTVLAYLQEHGKLFVDSRTTAESAGPSTARALGMPILQRDIFLDDDTREEHVSAWFDKAAEEARSRGTVVAIGHVQNRVVVDILRAAERTMASRGLRFARLGEVLSRQERKAAL